MNVNETDKPDGSAASPCSPSACVECGGEGFVSEDLGCQSARVSECVCRSRASRFTGDDAEEGGERLVAAIVVALEKEAKQLRKKIVKVEQLGFACPRNEIVEARRRLAEIDEMLSR